MILLKNPIEILMILRVAIVPVIAMQNNLVFVTSSKAFSLISITSIFNLFL